MSTNQDTDPNLDAARIVGETVGNKQPAPASADLEAAWIEWSKSIKNVDERGMTLLKAAFEAGYEAGSSLD